MAARRGTISKADAQGSDRDDYSAKRPTDTLVARIKRDAKTAARSGIADHTSGLDTAATLEEAATLARDKLARWQRMRSEPVLMIDGPSTFRVAIMPQRPGKKPVVLRTCASGEESGRYLAAYKGSA